MHGLPLLPAAADVHVPEHCLTVEPLYQATNKELSSSSGYNNKK